MASSERHIRFIHSHRIDRAKWQQCLSRCPEAHVYATAIYLDLFTHHWGALVMGDYRVVMPIPYKIKWGIRYTYTPVGIAQLGIIGQDVDSEVENQFLKSLQRHFLFGSIHLNPSFSIANRKKWKMTEKVNYILPLHESYDQLASRYTKDAKRNLRVAQAVNPKVKDHVATADIEVAFMQQYGQRGNTESLRDEYKRFASRLETLCEQGLAEKVAVYSESDELLAGGVFAHFGNRVYYVFGAPTIVGREYSATHVLIDAIIRKYASSNKILDFEGSSIPSVAMFYKKFAPLNEPYPLFRFQRLPWPLNRW